MNKGLVILFDDYCKQWERILLEEKPATIGFHWWPPNEPLEKYLKKTDGREFRQTVERLENAGITVEHELHTASWLLPREDFEKYPEFFRFSDGKRTPDFNFCASSKPAQERISERAYLLAKRLNQTGNKYHLWCDDSEKITCKCENCRNLSGSDQAMIFTNAVARGLRAYSGSSECAYLAYADAVEIPNVKPEGNVFLEFAPIHRAHNLPLSADNENNRRYSELLDKLLGVFQGPKVEILDYYLDVSMQYAWKRDEARDVKYNRDVVIADERFYRRKNINTLKSFAAFVDERYFDRYTDEPFRDFLKKKETD